LLMEHGVNDQNLAYMETLITFMVDELGQDKRMIGAKPTKASFKSVTIIKKNYGDEIGEDSASEGTKDITSHADKYFACNVDVVSNSKPSKRANKC
jgi:hypothetical protein